MDKKTTNEGGQSNIDCGSLWQKFETGNIIEQIPGKLSDDIYAVYFDYEGDYTMPFSYFIGCKVKAGTETPNSLTTLFIPADEYTTLLAKGKMPDCIANAWIEIWNAKIDRKYSYDFEIYDARSKDWNNAELEIFVATA